MPEQPETTISEGAAANVPLLIGATSHEFRFTIDPALALPDYALASMLGGVIGRKDVPASTDSPIAAYRALLPDASNSRLFGEIFTGYVQAQMARIVDLKSSVGTAPVWFYLFAGTSRPPL